MLDAYGVKPGPGRQLRPPVPDGPPAERGRRALRRNLPAGLGPPQQPAQGPDRPTAAAIDQPTAALLADLEQRGLLDETLVLFGSEFGRMPTAQGPDGRDHNITGYPMWLAGAGVKQGFSYGAHRRVRHQGRRGPHAHQRPARHAAGPDGPGPRAADLPLRRPRLPPDRRGREGRQRNLCVAEENPKTKKQIGNKPKFEKQTAGNRPQ